MYAGGCQGLLRGELSDPINQFLKEWGLIMEFLIKTTFQCPILS